MSCTRGAGYREYLAYHVCSLDSEIIARDMALNFINWPVWGKVGMGGMGELRMNGAPALI